MSSYAESRRDLRIADDYLAEFAACRSCNGQTERKTLFNLGGMCHACYQHYLDAAPSSRMTRSEAQVLLAKARMPGLDGHACANALRARRERQGYLERPQAAQLAALEAIGK